MKILITGAAGFLGRAFVRAHLETSDEVYGVDNLVNPHSAWPTELTIRIERDAGEFLSEIKPNRFDRIYHFASPVMGREQIERDPLYNADALRLDAALFRYAVSSRRTTIVYPSSSAVYGAVLQTGHGQALHEGLFDPADEQWWAPDELYGFTKMAGEVLAYKAASYGVSTLCLRPFSGYGEEQSLDYPVPSIAKRAAAHQDPLVVWGTGNQCRDFIHVDDIVMGTRARLVAGVNGYVAMNLGSGVATPFRFIAAACAQAAAYAPTIQPLIEKPEGVAARYGDMTEFNKYHTPLVALRDGLARMVAHYA